MQTLLRLEGDLHSPARHAATDALLRRHLHYSSLTNILAAAHGQVRQYLWTSGCPGCGFERCLPGCHADLLRRALQSLTPAISTQPVPAGFAPRPFVRGVVAWPTPTAQLPNAADLEHWPEYRLNLTWQRGTQPRLTLLWLIGAAGPAPQPLLGQLGWHSLSLPTWVVQWQANQRFPQALPWGSSWPHTYQLLEQAPQPSMPTAMTG